MNPPTQTDATSRFSGPGHYRIEIEGKVRPERAGAFGDMGLSPSRSKDGRTVTVLEGSVRDQAALAGILNALYELHLPLLSVQRLEDPAFAPGTSSD